MTGEISPNETSRYLIAELETVVNDEYLKLLRDSQHSISVQGYLPPQRSKLPDMISLELANAGLVPDELRGINVDFTFPATDPYGGLKSYSMHWNNGVNWTCAVTKGSGPIAYAGHGDRTIGEVNEYRIDDVPALAEAAALPYRQMTSTDPRDIEEFVELFARRSPRMHHGRERLIPLNAYSALRVIQDSTILNAPGSEAPDLIQELRLEVTHFGDFGERYPAAQLYNLPTAYPIRGQHIVFHQDPTASKWQYYAAYDGPIRQGIAPGEYDEAIDKLIPPPTRLSILINEALESMAA